MDKDNTKGETGCRNVAVVFEITLPSLLYMLITNLKFLAQMVRKLCKKTKPEVDMRPPSWNIKFLIFDNTHPFPSLAPNVKFLAQMVQSYGQKRNRKQICGRHLGIEIFSFSTIPTHSLIITYFGTKLEVPSSNGSKVMAKKRNRKQICGRHLGIESFSFLTIPTHSTHYYLIWCQI